VKIIRTVIDNRCFLSFSDSYLGAYGSAGQREMTNGMNSTGMSAARVPLRNAVIPAAYILITSRLTKSAGSFLSGQRLRYVSFHRKLIQALVQRIRETDGLIVVNEVTTGIGRTGKWFGFSIMGYNGHRRHGERTWGGYR